MRYPIPGRNNQHKPGHVPHAFNLSAQEMEAGVPGVHGHPRLHSEFEDNLDYMSQKREEGKEGGRDRKEERELNHQNTCHSNLGKFHLQCCLNYR